MDSEESVTDVSTKKPSEKSSREIIPQPPRRILASDCFTFVKKGGRYVPAKQKRLKNSLLLAVGFLELGNAGDFAANVFNEIPVPTYAVAFMAVGGTLALALSYFAFQDARLSLCNLRLLRQERHDLQRQKTRHAEEKRNSQILDTSLSVSFREIRTESIGRMGMDAFLGFGAVIISIGTFLAIGGANRGVWHASNLLSGYVGNAPMAVYALVNASWCSYAWAIAREHGIAGATALKGGMVESLLRRRVRNVQMFAVLSGVTSIVGGVGSLIATTRWWGYVILIPVIISAICCNHIWRHWIAYERWFDQAMVGVSKESLVRELEFVVSVQRILEEMPSEFLPRLVSEPQSIASVVEFIVLNDLFEDFCGRLLCDTHLSTELFGVLKDDITISARTFVTVDKVYVPQILEIATTCISEIGPTHFQYQERYLLETLGSYLCIT